MYFEGSSNQGATHVFVFLAAGGVAVGGTSGGLHPYVPPCLVVMPKKA